MLDGHETQRGQIDLGVDLRGVWTAMPQMVPDFLEGEPPSIRCRAHACRSPWGPRPFRGGSVVGRREATMS